jgi:hypothetical protein
MIPSNAINFNSIPKFSEFPIAHFPLYVDENSNEETPCHYSPLDFEDLKVKSRDITIPEWYHSHKSSSPAQKMKMIAYSKELDWFHGLEAMEKELLPIDKNIQTALTVDSILKYNGYFSRLVNLYAAEFRHLMSRKAKYTFEDINETVFLFITENHIARNHSPEEAEALLRSFSAPETKHKTYLIKRETLEGLFESLLHPNHPPLKFESEESEAKFKRDWHLISPKAVQKWITQQGRTDDNLDIAQWLRERVHYYPVPTTLEKELQTSIDTIASPEMHPIEKAARIWFDIARMNMSHKANRRTGKAICAAILLKHGYLPPKIGPEDKEEYVATLRKGMEEVDGHRKFTKFVAKMISKTHNEMASKLQNK